MTHLALLQDHNNSLCYNPSRIRVQNKADKFQVGIHYACSLLTDSSDQADIFCQQGLDKSLQMGSNNQQNSYQQARLTQNGHSICQANLRNIELILNILDAKQYY